MMFPLDSRHLAVFAGAAAAVVATAYVVWGPSERRRQKSQRVACPGLVNLGNTCFLNAVLQAMAPCSSVCQWLELLTLTKQSCTRFLAAALSNVIKVLNNDSIEYAEQYCPVDIIRTLKLHGWDISTDEQDAHEMFHVLSETLSEETAQCPSVLPLFDLQSLEESCAMSEREAVCRLRTNLPVLNKPSVDHPFHGLFASQLCCKRCRHKCSVKYDTFDSLSLVIPPHYAGHLTLHSLLKHFVMLESVDGIMCERCGSHTEKSSFVKKLTVGKIFRHFREHITVKPRYLATVLAHFMVRGKFGSLTRLPQCLCLHIQRTVWLNNGISVKRFDAVSFPEVLNMGSYVYQKESPMLRPKILDLDGSVRLVGGRKKLADETKTINHRSSVSSPTMSVPYSGPVNMLKALNYHSRIAQKGLYGVHPTAANNSTNRQVQRLAQAYSTEAPTYNEQQNSAYKLTSVIVHLGGISTGHFITYRRAPSINGQRFPDNWLYTSDTVVKKVPLSEVLAADAYMLFYEKI